MTNFDLDLQAVTEHLSDADSHMVLNYAAMLLARSQDQLEHPQDCFSLKDTIGGATDALNPDTIAHHRALQLLSLTDPGATYIGSVLGR